MSCETLVIDDGDLIIEDGFLVLCREEGTVKRLGVSKRIKIKKKEELDVLALLLLLNEEP